MHAQHTRLSPIAMSLNKIAVVRFLREEAPKGLANIVAMSAVSGVAGAAILGIITLAALAHSAKGQAGEGTLQLVILFVIALSTLVVSKWVSIARSSEVAEEMLAKLRVRVCNKIRRSELESIEELNQGDIFTTLTRDTGIISNSAMFASNTCQQALLLVAGLLYLAWLSTTAFVLFGVVACACVFFYLSYVRELRETYLREHKKQAEYHDFLSHLLHGFKELRLSDHKSDEVFEDIKVVAREAKGLAIQTGNIFARTSLFADVALYLLMGTIVFLLPHLSPTYSETVVKTTIAVMFIFGPLASVVGSAPQISHANAALKNVYELEMKLDSKLGEPEPSSALGRSTFANFQAVTLAGATFSYRDKYGTTTFAVGPIDLTIERGEIVFIVGGNGSGKTTLLKLLTGLYHPKTGLLKVDGKRVDASNRQSFRELIAGVQSDFFLFNRLYGVEQIDEDLARDLLKKMEMTHKVQIVEGRFSTLDLSTGQRKRLALVASLLEDRQIYVFDEWSADQDPEFREQFYRKIVPELRDQGKTIIAITHDDRYWPTADRLIKLDFGKITVEKSLEEIVET